MGLNEKSKNEQPLVAIARIISYDNEEVVREATACEEDYEKYFEENAESYEERGIDEPEEMEEIKWIGLVDLLERHHYVCIRDWADEKDDFIYFLQNTEGVKKNQLTIEPDWLDEDDDISTWSAVLDEKWEELGMCVAALDTESDEYVLFACKLSDMATIQELAEACEFRADFAKNM